MTSDKVFYEWLYFKKGIIKEQVKVMPLSHLARLQNEYIKWMKEDIK